MLGIGFGTWAWGNQLLWGYDPKRDDVLLEQTFSTAINGGLSFIDTADSYGSGFLNGRSELLLGKFINQLPPTKRSDISIATKLAPFPWRIGRKGFEKAFGSSKRRLQGQLNRIQLHWSTSRYAPWQELSLLDGLADLVERGEVAEIGVSNFGINKFKFIYEKLANRGIKLKSLQIQFSLLSPEHQEKQINDLCKELGVELIAYSPLALGLLAIPPNVTEISSTLLRRNLFSRLLPGSKSLREGINTLANEHDVSPAQIALNWCRSHGAMPIPGIRTPQQAKDAASALKWDMSQKERTYLDNLKRECKVRMPSNPFQSS